MDDKEAMLPASTRDEGASGACRSTSAGAALPSQRQYLLYGVFFKIRGLMAAILAAEEGRASQGAVDASLIVNRRNEWLVMEPPPSESEASAHGT